MFAHAGNHRDGFVADDLQRTINLQLLDVFRQIARGHALVDVLVASQRVEFFDAGFDIVSGGALALGDGFQVYLVNDFLIIRDDVCRNIDAQGTLGPHHGNPQLPLVDHLIVRAPQIHQVRRTIAGSEDIIHRHFLLRHTVYYHTNFATA